MEIELRILSGLHRGATLPLDDATLLLGADETADVVLVDPGIVAHHATLQPTDTGWMLTPDSGLIYSAEQHAAQSLVDLVPGSFFRLAETWLTVCDADAAWQNLPAMPAAETPLALDDEPDAEPPAPAAAPATAPVTANAQVAMPAEFPEPIPAPAKSSRPIHRRHGARWLIAPVSLTVLLSAVAAFAYTAKPSQPSLISPHLALQRSDQIADLRNPPATEPAAQALLPSRKLAPEALRNAFRKRLKDADLLQHFDLDLNDAAWSMRAHLDDVESARFERVLKLFVVEHKISFPVNAKVGNAESMLPFKIRQIVTGTNAGIVTGDGERFYVGDEFQGVRLVAVVDNHLTFLGKRKIEVIW